jgi:hypothetical protein
MGMTIALIVFGFLLLVVAIVAVRDLTQRQHAVTCNFRSSDTSGTSWRRWDNLSGSTSSPVIEERPYNRVTRSWVYASGERTE